MVTIRDVAKHAGVSCSTVSRALSDSFVVNSKTRDKVLAAAEELNYIPNQMARGLKGGRSKTIQLIVPTIVNPFFPKLITCFEKEIRKRDYAMILGISNYSQEEELRCVENAQVFSADGILFVPGTDDCKHIKSLIDKGIPMILVNRTWSLGISCVTNDNHYGGYKAIEYLVQHGHRKIACVVNDITIQHIRERYEGCLQAFRDYNIPPGCVHFIYTDSICGAYEQTKALLGREEQPTAFFVGNDYLASGVYSGIINGGYSIPNDISVVGFDDIEDSKFMIPALTTWHHPIEQIAKTATERLIREIEGDSSGWGETVIIPGRMIERCSVSELAESNNV